MSRPRYPRARVIESPARWLCRTMFARVDREMSRRLRWELEARRVALEYRYLTNEAQLVVVDLMIDLVACAARGRHAPA